MNVLGLSTNWTDLAQQMHLHGLLEILAPFVVVVALWLWFTVRKGAQSMSRKQWVISRQTDEEGVPLLYGLDTEPTKRPPVKRRTHPAR
ncbi:MAG TPA: hypothetical protein VMV57_01560 [Terracidiphilus sp.]|nr:hypothetical protein [Terracidiphilus sp.]